MSRLDFLNLDDLQVGPVRDTVGERDAYYWIPQPIAALHARGVITRIIPDENRWLLSLLTCFQPECFPYRLPDAFEVVTNLANDWFPAFN